ncbi:MAG: HNH endonuclease [Clostridia bacterium]|nr:HNH endonuclease [Clostridia bacterium]
MNRGDVISYNQMTMEEEFSIQRGMNYTVSNKGYGIILMSVRSDAPYEDRFEDNGTTIIYEGHDVQANYCPKGKAPKQMDQPMKLPSGILTENGKFYQSVLNFKSTGFAKTIKVYEKIKSGIWVYNGYFRLIDAWIEKSGVRNVFKFKLEMIDEEIDAKVADKPTVLELEHNRLIPTQVKVEVWKRDKGRCVKCGSNVNLHYDHIIPFSKGGASTTAANIQLLCAKCNLRKHDNIE